MTATGSDSWKFAIDLHLHFMKLHDVLLKVIIVYPVEADGVPAGNISVDEEIAVVKTKTPAGHDCKPHLKHDGRENTYLSSLKKPQ